MTGAGDLFSSPQPVTAKPVRPLPLKGALRGLPQKGSAETRGSGAGEGFTLLVVSSFRRFGVKKECGRTEAQSATSNLCHFAMKDDYSRPIR